LRRAATVRARRWGVFAARAGRRASVGDSTVTGGSAVLDCALAMDAPSPSRNVAPINQYARRTLKMLRALLSRLQWLSVVTLCRLRV
jgi:hypothetical protein